MMNEKPPVENDKDAVEVLDLTIEKLVTGGAGLAHHDGMAVFVPLTAPGDRVRARVVMRRKGFVQAALEEILEPSPERCEAPCPHFGQCGGCDLQQLPPARQRQVKADIVLDCFQRLGKLDLSGILEGPSATGGDLGYRNRIRLFAHPSGPYGLMRRGTHEVVPLDTCPVMTARFNDDVLPWLRFLPPVEQIVVRMDDQDQWLVSVFGLPNRLKMLKKIIGALAEGEAPAPGCVGVLYNNLPVWGRDYLVHEVAGHRFRVGAQAFFQGNHAVTEEAVATVRAWLGELAAAGDLGGLMADLFCGVGLFSLTLADLFARIVAVDSDAYACRDARNNIQRDPAARGKVSLHEGPVAKVLGEPDLAPKADWAGACCVIDPPRAGLGKDGAGALRRRAPRHVLFMSCDPATLARDAAAMAEVGYEARKLRVLDMFPQTAHIETLLLMERRD